MKSAIRLLCWIIILTGISQLLVNKHGLDPPESFYQVEPPPLIIPPDTTDYKHYIDTTRKLKPKKKLKHVTID